MNRYKVISELVDIRIKWFNGELVKRINDDEVLEKIHSLDNSSEIDSVRYDEISGNILVFSILHCSLLNTKCFTMHIRDKNTYEVIETTMYVYDTTVNKIIQLQIENKSYSENTTTNIYCDIRGDNINFKYLYTRGDYTVSSVYDNSGSLKEVNETGGNKDITTSYEYDDKNRITEYRKRTTVTEEINEHWHYDDLGVCVVTRVK